MSSLSSAINSLSAVSVEDYCRYTNKSLSNQEYLNRARVAGIFWGGLTLLLSYFAGDIAPTVIEAINKVGSVFFGPVLACFVLGILDKRIGAIHINIGLLSGVFVNIGLWLFAEQVFWFWWNVSGFLMAVLTTYAMLIFFSSAANKRVEISAVNQLNHRSILTTRDVGLLVTWFAVILATCLSIPYILG
jgi:Na+/pantothenate symporter